VSSPPKAWSFYSVTLAASRKRADSGVGASTPQVLVVEAAGGCASALDVYVRQGTYPTIASFDGSSTQFRGGPNNTIVLVNGTQDAWSQGESIFTARVRVRWHVVLTSWLWTYVTDRRFVVCRYLQP
jgi:hypothetical protein